MKPLVMYLFVNGLMSESDLNQKECRMSSQSTIVCSGESRCLVLFISFLEYLKAVLFHSVSVNECSWTKSKISL